MDVAVLDDHIAEIDPDPEYDPLILGRPRIALGHPTLDGDRTGDGLNDAREFDEDAITGCLDDAALVFGNLGVDEFAAMGSEPCESAGFVLTHEAAISGDIGGENGREPALDPLSAQCFLPGRLPNSQSAPPMEDDQSDPIVRIINRDGRRVSTALGDLATATNGRFPPVVDPRHGYQASDFIPTS